eukprot:SAG31_NODE_409_length_16006_cov_10.345760_8_plen_2654_part_00
MGTILRLVLENLFRSTESSCSQPCCPKPLVATGPATAVKPQQQTDGLDNNTVTTAAQDPGSLRAKLARRRASVVVVLFSSSLFFFFSYFQVFANFAKLNLGTIAQGADGLTDLSTSCQANVNTDGSRLASFDAPKVQTTATTSISSKFSRRASVLASNLTTVDELATTEVIQEFSADQLVEEGFSHVEEQELVRSIFASGPDASKPRPSLPVSEWLSELEVDGEDVASLEDAFVASEINTLAALARTVSTKGELSAWLSKYNVTGPGILDKAWLEVSLINGVEITQEPASTDAKYAESRGDVELQAVGEVNGSAVLETAKSTSTTVPACAPVLTPDHVARAEMDVGKWCVEAGVDEEVEDVFFEREIDTLGELAVAVMTKAELASWLATAETASDEIVDMLWRELEAIQRVTQGESSIRVKLATDVEVDLTSNADSEQCKQRDRQPHFTSDKSADVDTHELIETGFQLTSEDDAIMHMNICDWLLSVSIDSPDCNAAFLAAEIENVEDMTMLLAEPQDLIHIGVDHQHARTLWPHIAKLLGLSLPTNTSFDELTLATTSTPLADIDSEDNEGTENAAAIDNSLSDSAAKDAVGRQDQVLEEMIDQAEEKRESTSQSLPVAAVGSTVDYLERARRQSIAVLDSYYGGSTAAAAAAAADEAEDAFDSRSSPQSVPSVMSEVQRIETAKTDFVLGDFSAKEAVRRQDQLLEEMIDRAKENRDSVSRSDAPAPAPTASVGFGPKTLRKPRQKHEEADEDSGLPARSESEQTSEAGQQESQVQAARSCERDSDDEEGGSEDAPTSNDVRSREIHQPSLSWMHEVVVEESAETSQTRASLSQEDAKATVIEPEEIQPTDGRMRLIENLTMMKMGELGQRARNCRVSEDLLNGAYDNDHPKEALIELIVTAEMEAAVECDLMHANEHIEHDAQGHGCTSIIECREPALLPPSQRLRNTFDPTAFDSESSEDDYCDGLLEHLSEQPVLKPPILCLRKAFDPTAFDSGSEDETITAADLDAKMAELEHRIRKRASKIGTRTIDELASGTSIAVQELQEHVAEKVAERVAQKSECSRDVFEWLVENQLVILANCMQQNMIETLGDLLFLCPTEAAAAQLEGLNVAHANLLWGCLSRLFFFEETVFAHPEHNSRNLEDNEVGLWMQKSEPNLPESPKHESDVQNDEVVVVENDEVVTQPKIAVKRRSNIQKRGGQKSGKDLLQSQRGAASAPRPKRQLATRVHSTSKSRGQLRTQRKTGNVRQTGSCGTEQECNRLTLEPISKLPKRRPSAARPKLAPKPLQPKPALLQEPPVLKVVKLPKPAKLAPPLAPMLLSLLATHRLLDLGRPLHNRFGVVSVEDLTKLRPTDALRLTKSKEQQRRFTALLAALQHGPDHAVGGRTQHTVKSQNTSSWGAIASPTPDSFAKPGDSSFCFQLSPELKDLLFEHKLPATIGSALFEVFGVVSIHDIFELRSEDAAELPMTAVQRRRFASLLAKVHGGGHSLEATLESDMLEFLQFRKLDTAGLADAMRCHFIETVGDLLFVCPTQTHLVDVLRVGDVPAANLWTYLAPLANADESHAIPAPTKSSVMQGHVQGHPSKPNVSILPRSNEAAELRNLVGAVRRSAAEAQSPKEVDTDILLGNSPRISAAHARESAERLSRYNAKHKATGPVIEPVAMVISKAAAAAVGARLMKYQVRDHSAQKTFEMCTESEDHLNSDGIGEVDLPKPKRLSEEHLMKTSTRLSAQHKRKMSPKRDVSATIGPRFSTASPRSGVSTAVTLQDLPGMAAKNKHKAKMLSADMGKRRQQLAENVQRLSVPKPLPRQPTDEELGITSPNTRSNQSSSDHSAAVTRRSAVVSRLVDTEHFTGTHFLRHQVVTSCDHSRSPGGLLGFLPASQAKSSRKTTQRIPPRASTSAQRSKPPKVCAFQLTSSCRGICREILSSNMRRRRPRQQFVWVEYGPELGSGGSWACKRCETKRQSSPVAALAAVVMAAGASAHAHQLAGEGIATVDMLAEWSDGELRSIGIPTPVIKRLRQASSMHRRMQLPLMAPGSRPVLARRKRSAATGWKSNTKPINVENHPLYGPSAPMQLPGAVANLIEHTACYVAISPEFERTCRRKRRGDNRFSFLRGGVGSKYYKARLLFERQQLACLQSDSLSESERKARRDVLFASNGATLRRLGLPPNAAKYMKDQSTVKFMMQNVRKLSELGLFPDGAGDSLVGSSSSDSGTDTTSRDKDEQLLDPDLTITSGIQCVATGHGSPSPVQLASGTDDCSLVSMVREANVLLDTGASLTATQSDDESSSSGYQGECQDENDGFEVDCNEKSADDDMGATEYGLLSSLASSKVDPPPLHRSSPPPIPSIETQDALERESLGWGAIDLAFGLQSSGDDVESDDGPEKDHWFEEDHEVQTRKHEQNSIDYHHDQLPQEIAGDIADISQDGNILVSHLAAAEDETLDVNSESASLSHLTDESIVNERCSELLAYENQGMPETRLPMPMQENCQNTNAPIKVRRIDDIDGGLEMLPSSQSSSDDHTVENVNANTELVSAIVAEVVDAAIETQSTLSGLMWWNDRQWWARHAEPEEPREPSRPPPPMEPSRPPPEMMPSSDAGSRPDESSTNSSSGQDQNVSDPERGHDKVTVDPDGEYNFRYDDDDSSSLESF